MSMREVLNQILDRQDDAVKKVMLEVLRAEQEKIDMDSPVGIYNDLQRAIDEQVRREEQQQ